MRSDSAPARTFARSWSGRPASVAVMSHATADAVFRARVEDAIERDDPAELADLALEVGVAGEPWEWAQSCCIQLAARVTASVWFQGMAPPEMG